MNSTIIRAEEPLGRDIVFSFFKSVGILGRPSPSAIYCLTLILSILLFCPLVGHSFEAGLENDIQKSFERGKTIVATILAKVRSGSPVSLEISQLKATAENIRISNLLLEERFKLRAEKVKSFGSKAVERHQAMAEGYRQALVEYLGLIDSLPADGTVSQSTIRNLQSLFAKILPKKKRPIIGSLPYKHLNLPAIEPTSASAVTPAYKGGNKTVSPDDTAATPEAPLSNEIAALAQSLNWNPVSIYEYVKNNVETEWYWGCMKGAEDTLHQKSGNDCDQAALLTALLRASGFPTRYVRGVVEFFPDVERAKNLTGIDDPAKIAEFFQKAGIPYKPVIQGGTIANFQIEHVWIESQIPYSNYRGAMIDAMGKTWLGLDTSIKVKGYTYNSAPDILSAMSFSTVRDEYLGFATAATPSTPFELNQTPLEYLQSRTNSELTTQNSQLTYTDYLRTKTIVPEVLNILPASTQFTLVKATNEYVRIPDELIHQVKFTATDPNQNELFTITLPSYKLSNQQIVISYEPETVSDQEIIDSYGGLDNTPAYLVHLRPVLKVNDERIVVAQGGVPMGGEFNLALDLISPNGVQSITNTHIVGNLSVIGISAQRASIQPQADPSQQKDAARLLYEEAMNYNDRWNKAEDELATLLHLSISRPIPTAVTVGGVIDVTYLLDTPHGFTWKGVFIDAAFRCIEAVSDQLTASSGQLTADSSERVKLFMQLSSLQGSVLENRIFEDDFQVQSVSTAKLMTVANNSQAPIITIDTTNIDSLLPTLPFDQNIKDDITNAVNQKLFIRIPQSEITYQDWIGIGYIKENLVTGESGWMLSGMIAGGMTAWDISKWNAIVAGTLQSPYSEPANYDPASAQYIEKIIVTDMQEGTVGTKLSQPLQVKVTDANHKAVAGVKLTFTVKAGGGTFGSATSIVATTNNSGVASATPMLGKYTKDNPTFILEAGYAYAMQAGENIIDASLPSGVNLTVPFTAIGVPKDADHLTPLYGNGTWGAVLSFAGFVSVDVEDIYNNPISNVTVTFTAANPVQNPDTPNCPWTSQDSRKTYLTDTGLACIMNSPTWGICGDTTKQTLTVVSNYTGAAAQVIFGGMEDAIYSIQATALNVNASFKLYTYDLYALYNRKCDGTEDPIRQLFITYTYPADQYGNSINAGKVGTTIPMQARLYSLVEGESTKNVSISCDSGSLTCSKIVGTRQYDTTSNYTSSSITFSGIAGIAQAGGVYTANYMLQPGLNTINIAGTGSLNVQSTYMACPGTCNTVTLPITQTGSATMQVYGVDIQTSPVPIILVDTNGYTMQDYTINYAITPQEYQAGTAYVMIYKNDDIVAQIPAERQGQGFGTISRGFYFDLTSSYYGQVVLNFGTGVEIRGEKKTLSVGQMQILSDDGTNTPMQGAVTDDVTTLKLQLTINNGWQTLAGLNWSITDPLVSNATAQQKGTLLDGNNPTGSLPVTFDSNGVSTARYEVPTTFVRFGSQQEANDKNLIERGVQIQLKNTNNDVLASSSIKLRRPPVVLVHGLWSNKQAWNNFEPALNDKSQFMVGKVNYSTTNDATLVTNFKWVSKTVNNLISDTKEQGYAVTTVDIIGHSMGGLLARGAGVDDKIHKLITIDTPHRGSELATRLRDTRDIVRNDWRPHPIYSKLLNKLQTQGCESSRPVCRGLDGAIDDLVPGSIALNTLPQGNVTMYTVVGIAGDGIMAYDQVLSALWGNGMKVVFNLVPDSSFLPMNDCGMPFWHTACSAFFNESNDRIVTRTSQGNGSAGDTFPGVDHLTVLNNDNGAIVTKVKNILEQAP